MRYSVTTGAAGTLDPVGLADLAVLAEEHGWDGFFCEDYLVYQGRVDLPTWDPWVCLAAMAAATTRIRLGLTVTPVSRRRPWKLASEAATVDRLSGGRLVLGAGLGDTSAPCFGAVGEPTAPRVLAERLDESLEILAGLWSGGTVRHHGAQFRVDDLRFAATPVQRPRIPIWVGGDLLVPGVRRRIARWDGSCAYKGTPGSGQRTTPDDVRELLAYVATERGSLDGFDVKVGGAEPAELAEFAAAGATWCGWWTDPEDPEALRDRIWRGPPRE